MKKNENALWIIVVFVALIVVAAVSHEWTAPERGSSYDFRDLKNYVVMNDRGEYLGRMLDLVVDAQGRVDYAVLTRPGVLGIRGRAVAVPFRDLSLGNEKKQFVLNMTQQQMASLPDFQPREGGTYRAYGVQAPWTEK
jgi:sporulation protein YlmC with PRC-barrel domain